MVTNEISSGARLNNQSRAIAEAAGSSGELGDRFSELLRQLVGDADLNASFGGAANLGFIQVQVALPQENKVETENAGQEIEVKEQEQEVEDKGATEIAPEEADENDEEATDEEVVVAPEVEAVKVVPVVAANTEVAEATQVATEELPVEMIQEEAVSQVSETPVQEKEIPSFQLQKAANPAVVANERTKMETTAKAEELPTPTESFQNVQAAAVTSQKNGLARQTEKNPQEDYARLQRILEESGEQAKLDETPLIAKGEGDSKPAVSLEKTAIKQETIIAQQSLNSRLAADGESVGSKSAGKNGGTEVVSFGNSTAVLEKAAAGKGKPERILPPRDAQKVVEQLKELLQKAIQNRDGNTISVRLNPPELGQMTVKVTQRESQVYARIIPESPEVEAALRARAGEVTQVLVAAGLKADQVLVSIGRERTDGETLQFQQFMGQSDSRPFHERSGQAGGGEKERSSFFGSSAHAGEELVADSGWIA